MYDPPAASDTELSLLPTAVSSDFEFVELFNPSLTDTVSLLNKQLTGDVQFTFPSAQLGPGKFAVVAADPVAFAARYGDAAQVFGPWQGELNDDGTAVQLLDGDGHTTADLLLGGNDLWPFAADGLGSSLELIDPTATPSTQVSRPNRWQASIQIPGTPGDGNSQSSGVIINEVFAGTETVSGQTDQVELLNTSGGAIDISGWQLSNSATNEVHYIFPPGTELAAGDFLVLTADQLNPTPAQPEPHHFQLDAIRGDQLFLTIVNDQGRITRRESSVRWGSNSGQSCGYDPDRANSFTTLSDTSFGSANSRAAFGPAVISEVNFHPGTPSSAALTIDPTITSNDLEYVEVYNPTQQPLDLSDWRLDGVVSYQFAPGTLLGPDETVVVMGFDPAQPQSAIRLLAFLKHYQLAPGGRLVGPYAGNQPDDYGRLVLLEPGTPTGGEPEFTPLYLRDEARYDDLAPWPAESDGNGRSLDRRAANVSGLSAEGWLAKTPSPGEVSFVPPPESLLPDLVVWEDPLLGFNYFDYLDVHPGSGRQIMRFSTAVKNAGDGPLTVRGGDIVSGQQQVLQVVTNADGSTSEYAAGYYVFHPTHGHVHFGDYAFYRLYQATADGGNGPQVAGGEKVSFCLIDSAPFDMTLPSAPKLPTYSSCERQTQGISVGWADIYAADIDDQWIDIEDIPPGTYWLETIVDPFNHLIEKDETNNVLRHKVVLGVPEYEPDEMDAAGINERRLGTGDRHLPALSIHRPGDIDTFRWIAPTTGTLDVDLSFDRDLGDVDLYVWGTDSHGEIELVSATTEEHGEQVSIPVTGGKSYFVVVKELSGDTNPSYALTIDGPDIPPDRFEPNDSVLQPTHLASASHTLSDLTIDDENDSDFFTWTAPATATLLVDLQFNSAQGNIDLYVHDFEANEVASSTSNIGRELVEVSVEEGRTYVIVVKGRDGDMVSDYDLTVDLLNIPLDAYEPNDSQDEPAMWSAGDLDVSDLSIHKPFNRDYYRWQAPADGPVAVDLLFAQADGDIDLALWYDGESVAQSSSSTDNERVVFDAEAGQVYVIEVAAKNGATNAQYRLVIEGPDATADQYEPNDSLLTATDLGEGDVPAVQANIHASFNSDFYLWAPVASGVIIVDLLFEQSRGDLDLVLWADGAEIAVASTEDDAERLFMYIDADLSYVIEVRGKGVDINPSYELRIDGPELAADSLEPNDALATAVDLGIGDVELHGMNIHEPHNSDFYLWTPAGPGTATIDLLFSHDDGDLDLAVWVDGVETATSESIDDNEQLMIDVTLDHQYTIEVRGKNGAVNPHYEVEIDSPASVDAPRVTLLNVNQANSPHQWSAPIATVGSEVTIPWQNWQHIQIGFSEDVIVQADDLHVEGEVGGEYVLGEFAYNASAHLATWAFASPPATDRLTVTLSDNVTDAALNALDGDFNSFQFPSGNGLPGGAFVWTADVRAGDYAPDGQLDDQDIDALGAAIQEGNPLGDLNNDGQTTTDDLLALVLDHMGSTIGDVDLNGRFDSSDLVEMFAAGQFEDELIGNSTWATGDLNGDGEFDSSDLVFAFQIGGYES